MIAVELGIGRELKQVTAERDLAIARAAAAEEAADVWRSAALHHLKVDGPDDLAAVAAGMKAASEREATLRREVSDRDTELVKLRAEVRRLCLFKIRYAGGPLTFDELCATKLADEVAVLIQLKVIDARSPAGDALLDFRDPPSTPRADRLAELDAEARRLSDALEVRRASLEDAQARVAGLLLGVDDRERERDVARTALAEACEIATGLLPAVPADRDGAEQYAAIRIDALRPIAAGAVPAAPVDATAWITLMERKEALVLRKMRGQASAQDLSELDALKRITSARRNREAPYPFAELERIKAAPDQREAASRHSLDPVHLPVFRSMLAIARAEMDLLMRHGYPADAESAVTFEAPPSTKQPAPTAPTCIVVSGTFGPAIIVTAQHHELARALDEETGYVRTWSGLIERVKYLRAESDVRGENLAEITRLRKAAVARDLAWAEAWGSRQVHPQPAQLAAWCAEVRSQLGEQRMEISRLKLELAEVRSTAASRGAT